MNKKTTSAGRKNLLALWEYILIETIFRPGVNGELWKKICSAVIIDAKYQFLMYKYRFCVKLKSI